MFIIQVAFALAQAPQERPEDVPESAEWSCAVDDDALTCFWVADFISDEPTLGDTYTVCWHRWAYDGTPVSVGPCLSFWMEPS